MIKFKFIPNSLVFGIGWDKPDLFILIGVFYIQIHFSANKKQKRTKHEKIRPTNDYFYYDDRANSHNVKLCNTQRVGLSRSE